MSHIDFSEITNYCGSPPAPPSNTQATPTHTQTLGSAITYSCLSGYTAGAKGVPVYTCAASSSAAGEWSFNGGSCVCMCNPCILTNNNFSCLRSFSYYLYRVICTAIDVLFVTLESKTSSIYKCLLSRVTISILQLISLQT